MNRPILLKIAFDRDQMNMIHMMIRLGKTQRPYCPTSLRSLEAKVLACRLSAYNSGSYVLELNQPEGIILRGCNTDYCVGMADYLLALEGQLDALPCTDEHLERWERHLHIFGQKVQDALVQYRRATKLQQMLY
ncbi:hypothetical protein [Salmonirosea aquatica]|uniref:Uncharacterized protein n=1 Tax=Salmonirosea aquatica TaxID=2654236 RepID=A0A7C9FQF2_9BACT|nr:hypothetical protein [Cytophagaceae bacterium SJW1-29]